jgi:hypothetical protein
VKFEVPQMQQTASRRRRRSSETEKLNRIDTLCQLIEKAHQNGATLEFILNKQDLWHIKPEKRSVKVQEPQPDDYTLHDLLQRSKRLSERDRRRLAVILANAVLLLKDSRWLADHWDKHDVCFMQMLDGSTDLVRPYVATQFQQAAEDLQEDLGFVLHQCRPLLCLGIILLELGLSEPIEKQRVPDDLINGQVNVNSDLNTAERVLVESVDELHDNYRAAVAACLDCKFVPQDLECDFSNEAFRNLVHEHVIEPLETELLHGWGEKPSDLWADHA